MTSRSYLQTAAPRADTLALSVRSSTKDKNSGCNCSSRPTLKSPSSFNEELTNLIKTDQQSTAANSMRRQISRAVRRMTGVRADGQVSEEQLFAGIVGHEVLRETDRRTYVAFCERVRLLSKSSTTGHSAEDATKVALSELVTRGTLSQRTANSIYSRAFAAGQLDTNDCMLFDSRAGGRDHSSAAIDFKSALDAGTLGLTKAQNGQLEMLPRSVWERSAGHRFLPPQLNRTARLSSVVA